MFLLAAMWWDTLPENSDNFLVDFRIDMKTLIFSKS